MVGWCRDWEQTLRGDHIGISSGITGLIQIIASLTVSIWHWRQARRAQRHQREKRTRHDAGYGAMVLLPMYTTILSVFAIGDLVRGSMMLLLANHIVTDEIAAACMIGAGFFAAHVPNEGLAFALTRQSAGWRTVRRVSLVALITTATCACVDIVLIYHDNESYFNICYSAVTMIFYVVLWVTPSNRLFRRPALINYARYMGLVAFAVCFVNLLHVYYGSVCVDIAVGWLTSLIKPYIVFKTLLEDSHYWQGTFVETELMDSAEGLPRSPSRTLREPLLQPVDASVITSISSNVETLRRRRVHLLNYAYLALGDGSLLGAGGTARVYRAAYRGRPVAVKSVFCMELTTQHVADFTREASRLQQFQSPYVVELKGVCIRPPLLAMVLELCEYGSLNDVLTHEAKQQEAQRRSLMSSRSGIGIGVAMVPMGASLNDRSSASAITIHEQDDDNESISGFDTRGVDTRMAANGLPSSLSSLSSLSGSGSGGSDAMKDGGMGRSTSTSSIGSTSSSNFSDIGDRESISSVSAPLEPIILTWRNRLIMAYQCAQAVALLHSHVPPVVHLDIKSHNMLVARSRGILRDLVPFQVKISDLELSVTAASVGAEAANVPTTINWTAPELFGDGGRANITIMSDCYALGMVLYEIATNGVIPFEKSRNPRVGRGLGGALQRNESVCEIKTGAYRPPLPDGIEPNYSRLMQELWSTDPRRRPTAAQTVIRLRNMMVIGYPELAVLP